MNVNFGGPGPPQTDTTISTVFSSALNAMDIVNNPDFESITDHNHAIKRQKHSETIPSASIINSASSLNSNSSSLNNNNDNNTPVVNININIKCPYEFNKNNRFESFDSGPFILIVESNNNNIGLLHKMSLGKLIFRNLNFNNDDVQNIINVGKNRIKIILKSYIVANNLLNSNILQINNLRAYIPETSLFRKGVIRNVDPDLSPSEIKEAIQSSIAITDVRRITKNISSNETPNIINTPMVVLTFRGQSLPQYVSIYGARCAVKPYVYKVTQCLNCYRFGHILKQCKGTPRCIKCKAQHKTDSCNIISETPECLNCGGNHITTNKTCPKYIEQYDIKKYMAQNNIGFKDAKNKYRSFSQVTSQYPQHFPPLSNRFNSLPEITEPWDNEPSYFNSQNSRPKTRPQIQLIAHPKPVEKPVKTTQGATTSSSTPNKGIVNPYAPRIHATISTNEPSFDVENTKSILKSYLDFIKRYNSSTNKINNTDQLLQETMDQFISSIQHG